MNRAHRVFAMVLIGVLCLSALPALAEGYVLISGGDANIRSGPGLDYSQLGTMFEGDTASYLGSRSVDDRGVAWYYVSYGHLVGWVSSKYARLYGADASSGGSLGSDFFTGGGSGSSGGTAGGYVRVSGGDAFVRSGPGLNYDERTAMKDGQTATYLGSSSVDERGVTWYKVKFNGTTGWVSSRFAKLYSGSAPDSTVKVSGGNANLRSGPGLNYDDIGTIHNGETATYLGESSVDGRGVAWYKVKFNGKTGWVSSKYASIIGGASGGSSGGTVKVSGGNANLRSGPGLNYDDIGTIHNGETATYLGESSVDGRGVAWYKVKFNGTTGWVSSKYASIIGGASGGSSGGASGGSSGGTVKVSGGNANLRSGPGLDYDDIGTIHNGETATYLGESSVDGRGVAWYKVKFNGKTGWVSSKYATIY